MPKSAEEYLRAPYGRMLFRNDDGSFTAEMLEFPGCFAEGETSHEAIQNLDAAALEWVEAAQRLGREIPEPFTTRGYSGTISLRIPKALHRQAARMAERESVSLNQYLVTAIAARVGADDLFNRIAQRSVAPVHVGVFMHNATIVLPLPLSAGLVTATTSAAALTDRLVGLPTGRSEARVLRRPGGR